MPARYDAPFFSALRRYSHRPTGVFHALPASPAKSIVHSNEIKHMVDFYGLIAYLDAYRLNQFSMYGAVPLREIKAKLLELRRAGKLDRVRMLLLTNCTFDGIVYDTSSAVT